MYWIDYSIFSGFGRPEDRARPTGRFDKDCLLGYVKVASQDFMCARMILLEKVNSAESRLYLSFSFSLLLWESLNTCFIDYFKNEEEEEEITKANTITHSAVRESSMLLCISLASLI